MTKTAWALGLLAALVACGKKKGGKDSGAALKEAEASVKAANDLVPAAFKDKLKFKAVVTEDKRAVAIVPDGWGKAFMKGELEPPKDKNDFGFFTKLQITHTCGGECKARDDWAPVVDQFYGTFAADTKAEKDEKVGPNGRIVTKKIASSQTLETIYTIWEKGGMVYQYCRITLSEESLTLQPAFEKACTGMIPLRWDNED